MSGLQNLIANLGITKATDPYSYEPVPKGRFIRYLTLEPKQNGTTLRCSMRITSLDSAPPFEAISYAWGSDSRNHTIFCDDCKIRITANLHDALSNVRHENRPRNLWADSICINQQDPEEKSRQVDLMGDIYSVASKTLICLRRDPYGSGFAKGMVALLAELTAMINNTIQSKQLARPGSFPWPKRSDPILRDDRWACFQQLVAYKWFTRGWVVQEAALSPTVEVHWGMHVFDWDQLLLAAQWASTRANSVAPESVWGWADRVKFLHTERLRMRYPQLYNLFERQRFTRAVDQGDPTPLYILMEGARGLNFTCLHDYVYAMVNLARKTGDNTVQIQADYKADFRTVYLDFAAQYLTNTQNLRLLTLTEPDASDIKGSLKSWVPQWNKYFHRTSDLFNIWLEEPLTNPEGLVWPPQVDAAKNLWLRGVLIDSVRLTSDAFDFKQDHEEFLETFAGVWNKFLQSKTDLVYSKPDLLLVLAMAISSGSSTGSSWSSWKRNRAAFMLRVLKSYRGQPGPVDVSQLEQEAQGGNARVFTRTVREVMHNRRLVVTQRGYFALASTVVRTGDMFAIVFGAPQPFALRYVKNGQYKMLGQCFVPGQECGRACDAPGNGVGRKWEWVNWGLQEQDIVLC
ncbi:HET-domain-containing protein [Thozetella sp. PMI_491]|nr:HET-domain-containing protein [Thozetella sp. PMI_491]